jgi:plastocyanin
MLALDMERKIISFVLTAITVPLLIASAIATTSNYSVDAQNAASGTTVLMAKGSQAADNPEFFVPAEVTVKAGETITWKNEDAAIHTATSGKDTTPDGKFDTSLVSPGQSSKPIAMPNEADQYPYFCTLHPWMTGSVTVG